MIIDYARLSTLRHDIYQFDSQEILLSQHPKQMTIAVKKTNEVSKMVFLFNGVLANQLYTCTSVEQYSKAEL